MANMILLKRKTDHSAQNFQEFPPSSIPSPPHVLYLLILAVPALSPWKATSHSPHSLQDSLLPYQMLLSGLPQTPITILSYPHCWYNSCPFLNLIFASIPSTQYLLMQLIIYLNFFCFSITLLEFKSHRFRDFKNQFYYYVCSNQNTAWHMIAVIANKLYKTVEPTELITKHDFSP